MSATASRFDGGSATRRRWHPLGITWLRLIFGVRKAAQASINGVSRAFGCILNNLFSCSLPGDWPVGDRTIHTLYSWVMMKMTGDCDDLNPCDEMYRSPHKELFVSRPGILFFFREFLHLISYLLEKVHFQCFWRKSKFWSTRFTV